MNYYKNLLSGLLHVHAAQQCSGPSAWMLSLFSLKAFVGGRVPKCTLWRELQGPQSEPASHSSGLSPTQPLYNLLSSDTNVLTGMLGNFLSHTFACGIFYCWKVTFPPPSQPQPVKKCILPSEFSSNTTPSQEPSRNSQPLCSLRAWKSTKEDPEHTQMAHLPCVMLAPCKAPMAPCFSLWTLHPWQCSQHTQNFKKLNYMECLALKMESGGKWISSIVNTNVLATGFTNNMTLIATGLGAQKWKL